jgi:hypothetical protein|tara:strand:+ start:1731 stop:2402 length:672 start_codon:yes stop_codon:yes gene_type:complete
MFKKDNYKVVKNVIDKKLALFLYSYLFIKRNVAKTLFEKKYISPYENIHGIFDDPQVPGSYAIYGDVAMETLLAGIHPLAEAHTGLKLYPNCSYTRLYLKGNILKRHKDRYSCEISTTLNLGGDPWPIYLEPDKKKGFWKNGKYIPSKSKGIKIILNPGDMLIYRGNILEHWRNKFKGNTCAQVFLHYNNSKTPGAKDNLYDGRPHLGLPDYFTNIYELKNKK